MYEATRLNTFLSYHAKKKAQRATYRAPEYNMSASLTDWPGRLDFLTSPQNTNLVEDVEILLLVKFRWIPFCGFREVVKCLSQSEVGWPSCFSDRPQNTNLFDGVEILLPVKCCWIPFCGFRGEVENVSANQRSGGHLGFPIGQKKLSMTLRFCFLSSSVEFRSAVSEKSKCLNKSEAKVGSPLATNTCVPP